MSPFSQLLLLFIRLPQLSPCLDININPQSSKQTNRSLDRQRKCLFSGPSPVVGRYTENDQDCSRKKRLLGKAGQLTNTDTSCPTCIYSHLATSGQVRLFSIQLILSASVKVKLPFAVITKARRPIGFQSSGGLFKILTIYWDWKNGGGKNNNEERIYSHTVVIAYS